MAHYQVQASQRRRILYYDAAMPASGPVVEAIGRQPAMTGPDPLIEWSATALGEAIADEAIRGRAAEWLPLGDGSLLREWLDVDRGTRGWPTFLRIVRHEIRDHLAHRGTSVRELLREHA